MPSAYTCKACQAVEHSSVGQSFDGVWANSWDSAKHFECPSGQVLAGAYSIHDNGKEDRVWKFKCAGSVFTLGALYYPRYDTPPRIVTKQKQQTYSLK